MRRRGTRSGPGGPLPGGRARALALLALGLLLGSAGGVASAVPVPAAHLADRAGGRLPAAAPALSLAVSPGAGEPPLNVSAIATVQGGTPPYAIDVCFGLQDHTSPVPPCGTNVTGWNGSQPLTFFHLYERTGNYSILGLLSDAAGDRVGATALVIVENASALAASASATLTGGTAPLTVAFNDTIFDGFPPLTIQWTFGDGTVGSGLPGVPVRHVYTTAGSFEPILTVTDGSGHSVDEALPAIHVTARPIQIFGLPSGPGTGIPELVLGLLVGGTVVAVVAVRSLARRRLRREGNELVDRMEEAQRAPDPARGPPGP